MRKLLGGPFQVRTISTILAAAAIAVAPAVLAVPVAPAAHACTMEEILDPAMSGLDGFPGIPPASAPAAQPALPPPPAPPPPSVTPVQTPQVNPPTTVRSVTVPTPSVPSTTVRPVALPTPPNVSASPAAVAAAKTAPAAVIDPGNPPVATPVDVKATVQQNSKQAQAPQHWGFVDYDNDRHPVLYNPVGVDMTFRYFYDGDYRDVYVPAGGRVVLNTAIVGAFPFTAVGVGYVSGGYFDGGGSNPVVWNNVNANVPAVNTTVGVDRVTVVGHDGNAPSGQQDTMMLNDTTLARGQVHQGSDGGTVDIAATQATPGLGPWDNGGAIVNTALQSAPAKHNWVLYAALWVLAGVVLAGVATWAIIKRRRGAQQPVEDTSEKK
jgi:hypothetical protein